MEQKSDWDLLRDYVDSASQAAFAALVERHINAVYSTCRREVRDEALAQDVTQVVFLILARRAPQLHDAGTLSGWLFQTARFACRNALKQEGRRLRREEIFMQEMAAGTDDIDTSADWAPLDELLNESLAALKSQHRTVILLRFYEGKSVREVAETLGITEKAAEHRLARALANMRRFCAARGYVVPLSAFVLLLHENAVQAAPALCVASVMSFAGNIAAGGGVVAGGLSTGGLATATSEVVSLSQGVLKAMLMSQIKTGVVASVGFCVMAGATMKIADYSRAAQSQPNRNVAFINATKPAKRETVNNGTAPIAVSKKYEKSNASATINLKRPVASVSAPLVEKHTKNSSFKTLEINSRTPLHAAFQHGSIRLVLVDKPSANPKLQPAGGASGTPVLPAAKDLSIRPGEIAVEGVLVGVNNGRLIVDVTSFVAPNGKVTPLKVARPKPIVTSAQTVLHVRGKKTPVKIGDLMPNCQLVVIGVEKGNGEPMAARDISVWDDVKDGVYLWSGEAPPPVPEEVDPADVPPDDDEKRAYANEFPQGDFQKGEAWKLPEGWRAAPATKARILEKNGKRWLAIRADNGQIGGMARITLPLRPDWERVRVSAQMKVKNLKRGRDWWHTSRLDFNFLDEQNRVVGFGRGLNIFENDIWKKLAHSVAVPKGAVRLSLEAGLSYSTGELLIDNIRVEANAPIDALPIREGFPEGKFETIDGTGWPQGFAPWTPERVQVLEENGNRFIRLMTQPGQASSFDGRFAVPPEWKRVRVKARIRLRDYVPGKDTWNTAKIALGAEDEFGKTLNYVLKSVDATPSDEWKWIEASNGIPPGAVILRVQPQLLGAGGVFDVDDLDISDATTEELPSLPVTPDLPGGAFEELDEKGWPKGWKIASGAKEAISIVEENGNHFLRISSAEMKYIELQGRFKLPAEWKALTISGRIRIRNLQRKPDAKDWETARVGFVYENAFGTRAGGFQQSLQSHTDIDWKTLAVKSDIPRDAVYIRITPILNGVAAVLDVDDLKLTPAQPDRIAPPVYEWTREFPEGSFEHFDGQGRPLRWTLEPGTQIIEEEGNHFLRLASNNAQNTVLLANQWKLKPQWKAVRVRARLRGRNLKTGGNPLDGARLQAVFLDGADATLTPLPPPLSLSKDADWTEVQAKINIPPGAATIKLIASLSRTSGVLDVDDIYIEPLDAP